MAAYIMLMNYTDRGIELVKQSPERAADTGELAEKCGVSIKARFLTMGDYDLVLLLTAPDNDAVAKFALALGSRGNLRTTTLPAFSDSDLKDIFAGLP